MARATLIHNAAAGDGRPTGGELRELARRHGFDPTYATTDDDLDLLLQDPGDLVAVAGGDGTVGEVAWRLVGRGIPIAIIPVGTANNLARSLGMTEAVDRLVAGWRDGTTRPLNVGKVSGPWGERPMVESAGLGAFAHAMPFLSALKKGSDRPRTREAALRQDRGAFSRLLAEFVPRHLEIRLDGEPLSGDFLLVEIMNGPMLGPRLCLAPGADPGDGRFDVVLAREGDRRRLLGWLEEADAAPPRLERHSARAVEVLWDGDPIHVDGETWAGEGAALRSVNTVDLDGSTTVRVELAGQTVPILVPCRAWDTPAV